MPGEPGGFDIVAAWRAISDGRWWLIGIVAVVLGSGIAYALLAPEWYRADAVLTPVTDRPTGSLSGGLGGALGGLGGLASLAGISVGANNTAEPIAVLKSSDFTARFIEDLELLPVLFSEDWDPVRKAWTPSDPDDWPDVRDAVKRFNEKIRRVQEDRRTGQVTLSIEWHDPKVAAFWANTLVERLNAQMRQRALGQAEANIKYLQAELAATQVVSLQQAIGRVLEAELQKLLLARGSKEYSFRFIDRATVQKWRSRPKRAQIVSLCAVAGLALGLLGVYLRQSWVVRRAPVRQSAA